MFLTNYLRVIFTFRIDSIFLSVSSLFGINNSSVYEKLISQCYLLQILYRKIYSLDTCTSLSQSGSPCKVSSHKADAVTGLLVPAREFMVHSKMLIMTGLHDFETLRNSRNYDNISVGIHVQYMD